MKQVGAVLNLSARTVAFQKHRLMDSLKLSYTHMFIEQVATSGSPVSSFL